MSAKVKLPPELANLLRSELETAIYEAALHRDDELIASAVYMTNGRKWTLRRSLDGSGPRYPSISRTY